MRTPIHIGTIGAGYIAQAHAEAWRKEPYIDAVCSQSIESARALAR